MRLAAACIVLLLPVAAGGTQEDPELTDPSGDATRWPGLPAGDPSADFVAAWFHEDEDNLYLSMEVVEHTTPPILVPGVTAAGDHLIGVHVNGPSADAGCSGWGTFNVRDAWSEAGWRAMLRIYWPPEEQDGGCGGEDHEIQVEMEGNVAKFTVPWDLAPGLVAQGDELTFADTRAGHSAPWPLTSQDFADNLPGRPFAVTLAPPRDSMDNTTGEPSQQGEAERAVLPAVAVPVALAVAMGGRRR